jgi:Ca2+/Na+ antiporter
MKKGLISLMMMAFPISAAEYDKLYTVLVFVGILTLLFIVIYLMVGEEREETES